MKIKHLLAALSLAVLFCQPSYAKGFLLFNTGDELFEVAEFPSEMVSDYRDLKNLKAGYKCDRFALFWADIWTWNCSMVAVTPNESYMDLPEEIVSTLKSDPQYAFKRSQRSFWNHYGFLTFLAALGGMSFLRRIF